MKKMYFGGVAKSIKSWIEKNGKLEFDFWLSDEEVLQNEQELFYTGRYWKADNLENKLLIMWFYALTDMPFILQKLINDMMKAGLAISAELKVPIFSVLVQGKWSDYSRW